MNDDGYQISIVKRTRRGVRRLHTLVYDASGEAWWPWNQPSRKQLASHRAQIMESAITIDDITVMPCQVGEQTPAPRRPDTGSETDPGTDTLGGIDGPITGRDGHVSVEDGFDIRPAILHATLEALRGADIHEIDIRSLKAIESQYGSRIMRLNTRDADQRRTAEAALYAEIVRRCARLNPSS